MQEWNFAFVDAEVNKGNGSLVNVHHITSQRKKFGELRATRIDGYIYAIRNGAKHIYEGDFSGNDGGQQLANFDFAEKSSGLIYSERGVGGRLAYNFFLALLA
ncbi:unnamed protein product [Cylicocyclus nassatus]|uniref:Uncharacterized protein n=1 Tax=Cylicocyclus nassatus TaxID=53992 RepID=A0AA36HAJ6_CYLNA|nr:unnamed protein product [Cylicocyclus nassatus]CAJ0606791.1 unnamed protein product [Cylicocyclus nassatus]